MSTNKTNNQEMYKPKDLLSLDAVCNFIKCNKYEIIQLINRGIVRLDTDFVKNIDDVIYIEFSYLPSIQDYISQFRNKVKKEVILEEKNYICNFCNRKTNHRVIALKQEHKDKNFCSSNCYKEYLNLIKIKSKEIKIDISKQNKQDQKDQKAKKNTLIEIICGNDNCPIKKFSIYPSYFKKSKNHYCSRDCFSIKTKKEKCSKCQRQLPNPYCHSICNS